MKKTIAAVSVAVTLSIAGTILWLAVLRGPDKPVVAIVGVHDVIVKYRGMLDARTSSAMEESICRSESQVRDNAVATGEKTRAGHRKLTENVVSRVRTAAEAIGRERGLDLIIAVQDDGGVLYNSSSIDLTADVLAELSRTYRGELRRRP